MKIKFTPSARAQFLAVIEYIAAEDPRAARRVRFRVVAVWHSAQDAREPAE